MPGKQTITIIVLVLMAASCFAQRTNLVAKDEGTFIHVLNRKLPNSNYAPRYGMGLLGLVALNNETENSTLNVKTDSVWVGIDSGYYKCKTELTLVLLEKDGCKPITDLIEVKGFASGNRRMVMPALKSLPKRQTEDASIVIDAVEINIDKKKLQQKYFENYRDYRKQNLDHIYISEKEIKLKNSIFRKNVEKFITRLGYTDTTHKLSLDSYKEVNLRFILTGLTEYKFGRYCTVELTTTVEFPSSFGALKEKTYTTTSNIGFDDSMENHADNIALMSDAFENVILAILEDEEVKDKFINPEKELKKLSTWEQEITIKPGPKTAGNLEAATNAVVTVTQKNGHGSGCIISNDGYIITNYHVVGSDTADIYVIFNSGSKRRCRFVRGNPVNDLSLLKVDTLVEMPLKLSQSKNISVGADIYAIGTPQDISLGQSITKGIISGKRNIENKIYIQCGISVNRGNSGGALLNKEIELIGIVNAKLIGEGIEGVSFAIPAYYIEESLKLKIER